MTNTTKVSKSLKLLNTSQADVPLT